MKKKELFFPTYYIILFFISISWIFFYRADALNFPGTLSVLSQNLFILFFLLLAEFFLNKKITYLLAGLNLIYAGLIIFNSLILKLTAISLFESFKIFGQGGDMLLSMEEAGFDSVAITILAVSIVLLIILGAFLKEKLPQITLSNNWEKIAAISLAFFMLLSFSEQLISKNDNSYFARRGFPLYIQIFSKNSHTLSIKMKQNNPQIPSKINLTKKKKLNVILVVLESVRADVVNPKTAPNMFQLSKDSQYIANARTDAIYTSLALNRLLLDRPPYKLDEDVKKFKKSKHHHGSTVYKIFKKLGYNIYIGYCANFSWNDFYNRITNDGKLVDKYFCTYTKPSDDERNIRDNETVKVINNWIKNYKSKKPFFITTQLDASHWTYYFKNKDAKFKPYTNKINTLKLFNKKETNLLLNRYKNSVYHVDNSIGKIIATLKKTGKYKNTILIVASDHAEGFTTGSIGHSHICEGTIRIPMFIRLPGLKAKKIKIPLSHENVFPTVLDYIGVKKSVLKKMLVGKSLFDKNLDSAKLTFSPTLNFAELKTNKYTIKFVTNFQGNRVDFTPYKIKKSKNQIKNFENLWKKKVTKLMNEQVVSQ